MLVISFWQIFAEPKNVISVITAIGTIFLFLFLYKKYHLTKYQMMIFALLLLFWCSIIIARDYRKAFAGLPITTGGLGLDEWLAASVASAYGLISIFVRLPVFALSDYFKSRKFFIALSLIFVAISSVIVAISPQYITLLISSLAFGFGASLLSMFNVFFAETFEKEKALISVSILSLAPLLGEFLVAPFQYYVTQGSVRHYSVLWVISAVMAVVCLVFLIFVKDNKAPIRNFTLPRVKEALTNYKFITLCAVAIFISFIKFASSGSNMTKYALSLSMDPMLVAYLGVVFSVSQLLAGVIMGTILVKRIGVKRTLIIGIACSMVFTLIASFSLNPTLLFISYSFNGLGYGLTYNVLIGLAMQPFAKEMREVTMGIFQTFFAVGIYFGDSIYSVLFKALATRYTGIGLYQSAFLVTAIVCFLTIILCLVVFRKQQKEFLESGIKKAYHTNIEVK